MEKVSSNGKGNSGKELKWKTLKIRMAEGRRKPGVVSHWGRIYVVGGMTTKRKDLASVDVFNPVTEEWDMDMTPPPMTELCGTLVTIQATLD